MGLCVARLVDTLKERRQPARKERRDRPTPRRRDARARVERGSQMQHPDVKLRRGFVALARRCVHAYAASLLLAIALRHVARKALEAWRWRLDARFELRRIHGLLLVSAKARRHRGCARPASSGWRRRC